MLAHIWLFCTPASALSNFILLAPICTSNLTWVLTWALSLIVTIHLIHKHYDDPFGCQYLLNFGGGGKISPHSDHVAPFWWQRYGLLPLVYRCWHLLCYGRGCDVISIAWSQTMLQDNHMENILAKDKWIGVLRFFRFFYKGLVTQTRIWAHTTAFHYCPFLMKYQVGHRGSLHNQGV